MKSPVRSAVGLVAAGLTIALGATSAIAAGSFVGPFTRIRTLASTVPANGDVNPYGVAVVPSSTGKLVAGDVLVSNFNDRANAQGTGRTLMQVAPSGGASVFANIRPASLPGACPGGVGLTTALVVLSSGWVVVGSLPTKDGTSATIGSGCLIVLNRNGRVVETITGGGINGPWDMSAVELGGSAVLFVTNVLNGTVAANGAVVNGGTVVRLVLGTNGTSPPAVESSTVIGSGFGEHTDPAALVVGPTGVGLAPNGTLFVADTVANRIAAIPQALSRSGTDQTGTTVSTGGALNAPLGLAVAPGGDILTMNAGDGNLVETTPGGSQVAVKSLDTTMSPPAPLGAGTLFGLAVVPNGRGVYFVDDGDNTLKLLH